jgi:predicted methyltransferase
MTQSMSELPRRRVCLAALALVLTACGRKAAKSAKSEAQSGLTVGPATDALAWAVAGDWRSKADRARDPWRHPAETLAFWGLKPGFTVVEFWPGAGWYTDILSPFLASTSGKLYAAQFQVDPAARPAEAALVAAYTKKLDAMPGLYGHPTITAFGPNSAPVAPAGSADLAIFARNLPFWMAAGLADKAFRDAFAALKPGGVLAIEENREPPGGVQDALATDGYVQEAYVKRMAQEAGFKFDAASEINANPKDTHNHPFGAWTLPPWRQSAPKGKPDDPKFDHSKYDAIGETDRMTLRFVKPRA